MFTLFICLLLAAIFPYLTKIPVAYAMHKAGGYNNHYPRMQQARLEGLGSRALAAHQNSFEALLVFAIGIFAIMLTKQSTFLVQCLAVAFIICRVFYHICYLLDWALCRSLFWCIGITISFTLIVIACCAYL